LSASGVRSGSSNGGFIGGGQIGYNWQFYNSFVAGIEADIQGIASNNSAVTGFGAAANPIDSYSGFSPTMTIQQIRRSVDYLGTVRGRLGWLFTPTLLVYSSGGLAYGGLNLSANFLTANLGPGFGAGFCSSCLFGPSFGNGSYSDTRVGWTAGGGLEWMFWPNWSAKAEYLYYDLGRVSAPSSVLAGATNAGFVNYAYAVNVTTRFNGNIVRAGVNYHFNWAVPPVIAKY
ncbi:MAG: outer membrane protein, partial [Methylocystis sp.]